MPVLRQMEILLKSAGKGDAMQKLLLVDGSSLLHRAFYALPVLSNSAGQYTNAIYGFMIMFNKICEKQKPDHGVVCFDKGRLTFRNEISADYKAQRKETPLELRGQFALIKEVLSAAGVAWEEMEGYEADDLLGTLAKAAGKAGFTVEIFSGDKDILQLIEDDVTVYLTKRGISDTERWDEARFREVYGLAPAGLTDLKALMGDSSDNISGVPGIGEKTALKLLNQFGGLQKLYDRLPEVENAKLRAKLADNKEAAFTSLRLATIELAAPLSLEWPRYALPAEPTPQLRAIYEKLELRQLLRGLPVIKQAEPDAGQQTIFAAPAPVQTELSALPALIKQQGSCAMVLLPKGEGLALAAGLKAARLKAGENCPEELAAALQDPAIAKQAIRAKEISLFLASQGIELRGLKDDAAIAAYLLDPAAGDHPADILAAQYGLPLPKREDADAAALLLPELAAAQRRNLKENGLLKLYEEVELPLTQVLAGMERRGIRVEKDKLTQMSALLSKSAEKYQARIYELAGEEFNLNSPKQLGQVLFEQMGLPPLKKTKTGYSTDAEVLEQLAGSFEIARAILDFRSCFKLKSTYTDGLRPLIDAAGKVHTRFNQTVTATGRLSSAEPNLQNIPVRQELGRRIREVFTADGPQDMLLAADYNQIELRVLAHISQDAGLQEAFL
ncbi:MAG: DNA polymerase I, partial [Clostridiales bacterium]|nr:DNA polymerase I [Clostridiales bacterium]